MIDIEKIEKRTVRSYYDDGLFEIALGLIFLFLGGLLFGQTAFPQGTWLNTVFTVLFFIVLVSTGILVGRFVRFFKRRITDRRTGYVAFKKKDPSPKSRVATMVVAGIIGAALASLYGLSPSGRSLFPALAGCLLAVASLGMANKIGLARFFVLAAASAVIGVAIAAAGVGGIEGVSLYWGLFGLAFIISGLAALIVYLRRSPRPTADASEGPDAH